MATIGSLSTGIMREDGPIRPSRRPAPQLQVPLVAGLRNQLYLHEVVIAWRSIISFAQTKPFARR